MTLKQRIEKNGIRHDFIFHKFNFNCSQSYFSMWASGKRKARCYDGKLIEINNYLDKIEMINKGEFN